jgi:hypothetical protein
MVILMEKRDIYLSKNTFYMQYDYSIQLLWNAMLTRLMIFYYNFIPLQIVSEVFITIFVFGSLYITRHLRTCIFYIVYRAERKVSLAICEFLWENYPGVGFQIIIHTGKPWAEITYFTVFLTFELCAKNDPATKDLRGNEIFLGRQATCYVNEFLLLKSLINGRNPQDIWITILKYSLWIV